MRRNQILAWVMSDTGSGKNYEVALEVDSRGQPLLWLSGPGAGQPRIHCDCPSMLNRSGVDGRGNCKHIRAVLGYQDKDPKKNKASAGLVVHEVTDLCMVRNWKRRSG